MAQLPYIVSLRATVAANGSATLQHAVPRNEGLNVIEWYTQSTGAYNITGLRDSSGKMYANFSSSNPLPNVLIQRNSDNNVLRMLAEPLSLEGSITLYIDVTDTSGASNTITIILNCIRITQ